ncbi:8739_t:CDS:1, partial [Dentiscutata erythropus]
KGDTDAPFIESTAVIPVSGVLGRVPRRLGTLSKGGVLFFSAIIVLPEIEGS